MTLATWWATDAAPSLEQIPGLEIRREHDAGLLATMAELSDDEVQRRLSGGNTAYVAWLRGEPTTYGWVASLGAEIGELGLVFSMPKGDRYLWDFKTLPAFRSLGIYPRLLEGIIQQESADSAERLWIVHAPENGPSRTGIVRGGFTTVGVLTKDSRGVPFLQPAGDTTRAVVGGAVLGVAVRASEALPCWRCLDAVSCGCAANQAGPCCCETRPARVNALSVS